MIIKSIDGYVRDYQYQLVQFNFDQAWRAKMRLQRKAVLRDMRTGKSISAAILSMHTGLDLR